MGEKVHFDELDEVRAKIKGDEWENYLLEKRSLSSWISTTINKRKGIKYYRAIIELFDRKQLQVLDQWALGIVKDEYLANYHYISLIKLSAMMSENSNN